MTIVELGNGSIVKDLVAQRNKISKLAATTSRTYPKLKSLCGTTVEMLDYLQKQKPAAPPQMGGGAKKPQSRSKNQPPPPKQQPPPPSSRPPPPGNQKKRQPRRANRFKPPPSTMSRPPKPNFCSWSVTVAVRSLRKKGVT
eukprot:UN15630